MKVFCNLSGSRTSNSRFFAFVFLAVLGVFAAILVYKYLRLVLTIPLLLFGVSLLFLGIAIASVRLGESSKKIAKSLKIAQALIVFFGLLAVMISVAFSFLNLLAYFSGPTKAGRQGLRPKNLGRYLSDNSTFWLSDNLLGYSYKPNEKGITSKSVHVDEANSIKDILYDVTYNIDEFGNRVSLSPARQRYGRSAVFVGGSFAFGEGLEDSETLPSLFALKSGFKAHNLGMHGYGPHQALMQLSSPALRKKRISSSKVNFVFYRFIVDHVSRAAGYSSWDPLGPCYRLDDDQVLQYLGSFEECKSPLKAILVEPALKRLSSSSEPWTSSVAKKLINYRPAGSSKKELLTFMAVVNAMRDASSLLGARFVVLVEDVDIGQLDKKQKVCRKNEYAAEIARQLKSEGITVLSFSEIYLPNVCVNGDYVIRPFEDSHPSKAANKVWSTRLLDFVN